MRTNSLSLKISLTCGGKTNSSELYSSKILFFLKTRSSHHNQIGSDHWEKMGIHVHAHLSKSTCIPIASRHMYLCITSRHMYLCNLCQLSNPESTFQKTDIKLATLSALGKTPFFKDKLIRLDRGILIDLEKCLSSFVGIL